MLWENKFTWKQLQTLKIRNIDISEFFLSYILIFMWIELPKYYSCTQVQFTKNWFSNYCNLICYITTSNKHKITKMWFSNSTMLWVLHSVWIKAISMSGRKAVVVIFGCAPTGSPMNLYPEEVFRSELRRFRSKFIF